MNVYILEWYLFPEVSYIYGLGIFFAAIAVWYITQEINIRNLLVSSFFLLLSENIYQINMTVFVIFSSTFLLVKGFKTMRLRSLVKMLFFVVSVGGMTMLVNIAIMRLLPLLGLARQNTRIMSLTPSNLWNRFIDILSKSQSEIWLRGSGFLGFGIMGVFLLTVFVALLVVLIRNRKSIGSIGILSIALILAMNYAVILFPHLLTTNPLDGAANHRRNIHVFIVHLLDPSHFPHYISNLNDSWQLLCPYF